MKKFETDAETGSDITREGRGDFHGIEKSCGKRLLWLDCEDAGSSTTGAGRRAMSLRVMIVEDELLLAMDLEDILTAAGYEVIGTAADMHQALTLAERDRPDLALMDVQLARGTNGLETALILRERFDVPSLFISGNLDQKMRARAADCSPVGFVPKPYSQGDVLGIIATVRPSDGAGH